MVCIAKASIANASFLGLQGERTKSSSMGSMAVGERRFCLRIEIALRSLGEHNEFYSLHYATTS
jgi:hypothetical protein